MCFEVFDKFNSVIVSLPKLNVAITTCCNKKFCSAKYIIVLCINYIPVYIIYWYIYLYTGIYYCTVVIMKIMPEKIMASTEFETMLYNI